MKVKILYLYPDIMNLYGSSGNVRCLARHIEAAGAEAEITKIEVGDNIDFSDVDFVFMGAGTERSRNRVCEDFKRYKNEFKDYIEKGGVCLFSGNSFEILGTKITDLNNNETECLGLYDFESFHTKTRTVVDTICTSSLVDEKVIGFINKQTTSTFVANPMFRVLKGAANAKDRNDEGICDRNLFATQMVGPILVRNPHLREKIEKIIYDNLKVDLKPVEFNNEKLAYIESLKGLTN